MAAPKPTTPRRRVSPFAGYALAAGLLVLALAQYGKNASLLEKIEGLERADGERLLLYERQERQIDELEAQIPALAARLRAALNTPLPREPVEAQKPPPDAGLSVKAGAAPRNTVPGALEDILGAEVSEDTLRQSAAQSVEMQYGELFGLLSLPAERAETFRAALTMVVASQMKSTLTARIEGKNGEGRFSPNTADAIRAAAKSLLSEAEFAAFGQYQDALPERWIRELYSAKMALWAKALTAEERDEALDILVEEMLPVPEGTNVDLREQPGAGREALTAAGSRLKKIWPPGRYVIFDRFVTNELNGAQVEDGAIQSNGLPE